MNKDHEKILLNLRKYVLETKDKMRVVWNFQTNFKLHDVLSYCCENASDEDTDGIWSSFEDFCSIEWESFEDWFKEEWPLAEMNKILECHGGSTRYMDLFYQFGDIDTDGFDNWLMEDLLNSDLWIYLGFDSSHCDFLSMLCNPKIEDTSVMASFYCAYITSCYPSDGVSSVDVADALDDNIRGTIDWYMEHEFPVRNDLVTYINNFLSNQVDSFKCFIGKNDD